MPKFGMKVPHLNTTRIPVSRLNGQRSGLEAGGGILWRPCPSVGLSVRLSACLSVRQFVCPSVCVSVRPSVRPSVRLSVRLSICLSVCLSVRPSVCLSIRLSVRPSVCLSVCLFVCPFVRLLPTCERYILKYDSIDFNANWHKWSPGLGHER